MKVVRNIAHAAILAAVAATLLFAACSNSSDGSIPAPVPVLPQTPAPNEPAPQTQANPVTLATPLTLEAVEAGAAVTFDNKTTGPVNYKINGGEVQTIASGTQGSITLAAVGDKVEFFANNKVYGDDPDKAGAIISRINCSADCYVYGNIMSLVKSEGFKDEKTLETSYTFACLFYKNAHIKNKDGADLLLPATTITYGCYLNMFRECSSLKRAPALPATTLANTCYASMFYGCTSLTAAPDLPATTLKYCCYAGMFHGCTSLASVTCLATDISATNCTLKWLKDVADNGTFTKADGMTDWPTNSPDGIPSGWTVRDFSYSVPLTLEACVDGAVVTFVNKAKGPVTYKVNGGEVQTIASGATENITLANVGNKVEFFGDNKAYATNYSNYSNIACDKDCYVYGNIMSLVKSAHFEKATALEEGYTFACFFINNTHIKNKSGADLLLPATSLAVSCYASMFSDCTNLTAAPSLPATTLAEGCYFGMFSGCTSLTGAPELKATTLTFGCYGLMFNGCTSLTTAPSLPATTLANWCYGSMFNGCTSLNSVTCLATDISASGCTTTWLNGIASTGTFTKAAGMTDWTEGSSSGIPSGWTVVDKQ